MHFLFLSLLPLNDLKTLFSRSSVSLSFYLFSVYLYTLNLCTPLSCPSSVSFFLAYLFPNSLFKPPFFVSQYFPPRNRLELPRFAKSLMPTKRVIERTVSKALKNETIFGTINETAFRSNCYQGNFQMSRVVQNYRQRCDSDRSNAI